MTAGGGALLLARRREPFAAEAHVEPEVPPGPDRAPGPALAIAFASGFGVLAFQVLLIRSLSQFGKQF